jgi:uncharacterized protein YdaU (DUF1376 family)
LTDGEDLAYRRLIDHYYDTELPIPTALPALCRRLRLALPDVETILKEYFVLSDDGWKHDYIDNEIDKYKTFIAKQKANGSKGGRAKEPNANPKEPNAKPTNNNKQLTINNKQNEKSADAPILPSWIPLDAWVGFCEMRRRIKKPMTDRAVGLKIKDLEKFRKDGYDIGAILDKSTANNWSDLYEPKPMQSKSGHVNKQEALEASNRAVVERLLAKEAAYAQQ